MDREEVGKPQMGHQYYLKITNGNVEKEEGYFFRAGRMSLIINGQTVQCVFKHNHEKEVVYAIFLEDKPLMELEHPHYVPDCAPDKLEEKFLQNKVSWSTLFSALTKVGVLRNKEYNAYFASDEEKKKHSYEVVQPIVF